MLFVYRPVHWQCASQAARKWGKGNFASLELDITGCQTSFWACKRSTHAGLCSQSEDSCKKYLLAKTWFGKGHFISWFIYIVSPWYKAFWFIPRVQKKGEKPKETRKACSSRAKDMFGVYFECWIKPSTWHTFVSIKLKRKSYLDEINLFS